MYQNQSRRGFGNGGFNQRCRRNGGGGGGMQRFGQCRRNGSGQGFSFEGDVERQEYLLNQLQHLEDEMAQIKQQLMKTEK